MNQLSKICLFFSVSILVVIRVIDNLLRAILANSLIFILFVPMDNLFKYHFFYIKFTKIIFI